MRIGTLRHGILLTVAVIVVCLERHWRARPSVEAPARHITRKLALAGMAAATVPLLEASIVRPLARLVERRRWGLTYALGGRPPWLRGIIAVVLLDYTLYLWHVLTHRMPWLWRFHVHHVDLDLDATTGLRFHAGELAASIPWGPH